MGEQLHQNWISSIRSTEDTRQHWSAVSLPHYRYSYHCWINCLSIALAPSFAGLWRFPEGWNFKQWTRDDSKALMKVCNCVNSYIIYANVANLCAGLPTSNWRPCTGWYGAGDVHLSGVLLHSSTQCTWYKQPDCLGQCPSAISSSSRNLSDERCS